MYKNILKASIGVLFTLVMFTACEGEFKTSDTSVEVTVVDGYIKNATVTDKVGQTATYTSTGKYSFSNNPVYPISSTGGSLEDTNTSFDIDMSVSDGISKVISPITTFLGTNSTLLSKFANLGLGASTLDEFSVDYVNTENTNLAKLAQLLYVIQRDSSLTSTFKTSVENNSSLSSLNDLFSLASSDVNSTLSGEDIIRANSLLTAISNYSGTVANIETSLDTYKQNLINASTDSITHNSITYGTITSPHTGKVWLDRNIGASQVCTSISDSDCYGDYFQWGREADGHEKSTSGTTSTKESSITSTSSNFITSTNSFEDWTTADSDRTQRAANWAKTDGSSVCPSGYRVPTEDEIKAETSDLTGDDAISNATDLYNDFLVIPAAGYRLRTDGSIGSSGTVSSLATTTLGISSDSIKTFDADGSSASIYVYSDTKSSEIQYGISVRCIQD